MSDLVERLRAKEDLLLSLSADSSFGIAQEVAADLLEAADALEKIGTGQATTIQVSSK